VTLLNCGLLKIIADYFIWHRLLEVFLPAKVASVAGECYCMPVVISICYWLLSWVDFGRIIMTSR